MHSTPNEIAAKTYLRTILLLAMPPILGCSSSDAGTDAPPATGASVLSAYHGLDQLPAQVAQICGVAAIGEDGMPVTYSVQLDGKTVVPEAFAVETATGEIVTPVCATLRPADERLELRTVLLAGPFGTADSPPKAVEVVGALLDVQGRTLRGVRTETITPLRAGPSLLLAERFAPDTEGLSNECPSGTAQIVQLTWEGGVTGPENAALAEPQRTAVSVTLEGGEQVTPVALGDDDPDNIVHACLDTSIPARSVTVQAGFFHDPGDDANPETSVDVVTGGA